MYEKGQKWAQNKSMETTHANWSQISMKGDVEMAGSDIYNVTRWEGCWVKVFNNTQKIFEK